MDQSQLPKVPVITKKMRELLEQQTFTDDELDYVLDRLDFTIQDMTSYGPRYAIVVTDLIMKFESFKNMKFYRQFNYPRKDDKNG